MSIQQDIWTNFKTQLQADTTLSGYVNTFKFNRKEQQFDPGRFPVVQCFVDSTEEDDYIALPKRKTVILVIQVHGKVKNADEDTLETERLKLDEYLKNAIESDITLNSTALIANIGNSEFNQLNNDVAETIFTVSVQSIRFTAGSR